MTDGSNRPGDGTEPTDAHRVATDRTATDGTATDRVTTSRRIDRRDVLRLGAAGVAAALAGCSSGDSEDDGTDDATDAGGGDGTEDPADGGDGTDDGADATDDGGDDTDGKPDPHASIPYNEEYGTVVDVVADAGADPDGDESILPVLETHAGDDTLLYFPPGEYLLDRPWRYPSFERLGLVGEDATILPRQDYFGYLFIFGLPSTAASDLRFEGIGFDFTAENTAPRPLQAQIDDGLVVRDVAVEGTSGTARFDVTSADGEGEVRNLEMPDGIPIIDTMDVPEDGGEPDGVGVLVGPDNEGSLRFVDCHVSGFPGNGLYASPSNGPIEVSGGRFENNGIASVRVSSPATVRDVTVRCDEAPEGFENMRGIRLRHGESVLVENCTIEMSDLTYTDGALVIEKMMESATIRNLDVDLTVDGVSAVRIKSPEHGESDAEIDLEGVTITGDAGEGAAVKIADRNRCILNDLDIEQFGVSRDGVHLIRTTNSVLRDSEIDVSGDPLVLEQSQLQQMNNRL